MLTVVEMCQYMDAAVDKPHRCEEGCQACPQRKGACQAPCCSRLCTAASCLLSPPQTYRPPKHAQLCKLSPARIQKIQRHSIGSLRRCAFCITSHGMFAMLPQTGHVASLEGCLLQVINKPYRKVCHCICWGSVREIHRVMGCVQAVSGVDKP